MQDTALKELRKRFGERLSTSMPVRVQHGQTETYHASHPPEAVLFAGSVDDVQQAVRLANRHRFPVIAFGVGTSLEGNVSALQGGLCIDLSRMNRILRLSVDDLDVTVEAGVTRKQLNAYLHDSGLFFPIDPGADATVGGMAATRASGTNAVRYGTMRENVLSVTVVTPDGRLIRTARRARKSAAGYNLTGLFVGSEGTLGIIVDVTLRLYSQPEVIAAAVCPFPSIDNAVNTCIRIIQCGIPIARIELMDASAMDAVNQYSKLDYPVAPTLFLEFHGPGAAVKEQTEAVLELAAEFGGVDLRWSTQAEERSRLWQARHDALYAVMAKRPGCKGWPTDVCVPISRLAECIAETHRDLQRCSLITTIVGHVGDGNFHVVFLVDPDSEAELAEAMQYNDRLVQRALDMDGTCTGEHGIGMGKMDCLEDELGDAVDLMRSIKRALDPDNLMNPGKIMRL